MRVQSGRLLASCGLVVLLSAGLAGEAHAAIPAAERAALIALYNSTNGAGWHDRTNWRNAGDTDFDDPGTECTWFGVTCSGDNVSWLALSANGLSGPLPAELAGLTKLEVVFLDSNQLNGPLPAWLGSLSMLKNLLLYSNALTGGIPPELGQLTDLDTLWLHDNPLGGTIPKELGELAKLTGLGLQSCQLTGTIPPELAGLTSISSFDVSNNQLSGDLPSWLWTLTGLSTLRLGSNQLAGSIPASVGNLTQLYELDLSANQVSGPIPPEIGSLSQLAYLKLGQNQLTGTIPPQIGTLTNLVVLLLGGNQLTGPIPSAFASPHLWFLDLGGNALTGTIPASLGSLAEMRYLSLGLNQLTGPIPPELGSLPLLTSLALYGNQLDGAIPSSLGSLSSVQFLGLQNNLLTGAIPSSLGSLASVQHLDLSFNQLDGAIPSSLGSLASVVRLDLSSNQLTGSVPSSLGTLTTVRQLHLRSNRLDGTIPVSLGGLSNLTHLSLGRNRLSGPLPAELGSLSALQFLSVESNLLTGAIPPELGSLTSLPAFSGLDLRWNGLFTNDPSLASFLASRQDGGDWASTQTVAPTAVAAGAAGTGSVRLSWTPIFYTGDTGGYRVRYGTTPGGPYPGAFGPTAGKTVASTFVTGLAPDTTYYFVVETVTDPHPGNQNTVVSELSVEVPARTASGPSVWYVLAVTTAGAGSGRVTSSPAGIDCGSDCDEAVVGDSVVTLIAIPDQGSQFQGWSGGCTGVVPTCDVVVETADVAVTATFVPPPPTSYYTVDPCRAYDSRVPSLGGPAPLAAGSETHVTLTGPCGIPAGATAVSLNLTATEQTQMGHLRFYPRWAPRPSASMLNYRAGQNRANNAVVPLSATGEVTVYVNQPGGTTHVVIDVNGYYAVDAPVDRAEPR